MCNIERDAPPKCLNCVRSHWASFRGCLVVKEIQKRCNLTARTEYQKDHPRIFTPNNVKNRLSYAGVTKNKEVESVPTPQSKEPSMIQLIKSFIKKIDEIFKSFERLEAKGIGTVI